jgi:hypothetical protein
LECAGNTATKCVAIGNRRHSLLLIIVGYFVRAAATFLFPGREMSASESRIFLDFRMFVARHEILLQRKIRSQSGESRHGRTCYRFDPVVNDPTRT